MTITAAHRIETERLILRLPEEADFEAWAEAHADPGVTRYTYGRPQTRAEAWRIMAVVLGHWSLRGYGFYSIIEKATGQWVGRTGPWSPEGWPRPEVGWLTAPEHQRRGFGLEAARACMDHVIDHLGWDHVIHVILHGNEPSERVAQALGSVREYDIDDFHGMGPITVWGQSAADWRRNRSG